MSCDLGVWFPHNRLTNQQANELYGRLCEGDTSGVQPNPAVDAFYAELTAKHPEIDTVPHDRIDDHDYCPWSCSIDRPGTSSCRAYGRRPTTSRPWSTTWRAPITWLSTIRNPIASPTPAIQGRRRSRSGRGGASGSGRSSSQSHWRLGPTPRSAGHRPPLAALLSPRRRTSAEELPTMISKAPGSTVHAFCC